MLLRKGTRFHWENPQKEVWQRLTKALFKSSILAYPNLNLSFCIYTDASDYAINSVLAQYDPGIQKERLLQFSSRKLSDAETQYSAYKWELLAVIETCKKFRKYLYGWHFHLFTDKHAVKHLFSKSNSSPCLSW